MNKKYEDYGIIPTSLLAPDVEFSVGPEDVRSDMEKAFVLEDTFKSFGIGVKVIGIVHGHAVTRFELTAEAGTKASRITGRHDELMMAMSVHSLRIEVPVCGKSSFYIEVPNDKRVPVTLRGLVETDKYVNSSTLTVALGRYLSGELVYCDISRINHLLIGGSVGSGTVECIDSILTGMLMHSSPDDVRMILVDAKYYELSMYRDIPHLLVPVITDWFKTIAALKWAITEKERRFMLFAGGQAKDIKDYNVKYQDNPNVEHLPDIVIVINELAELMFPRSRAGLLEEYITRLAIDSKAAGIHLIIATEHPSVSVIAGVKKVIGSSIAFAVNNTCDSRTIIGSTGAVELIGKGDMLFFPATAQSPIRSQGVFVSDTEVAIVTGYIKQKYGADYDDSVIDEMNLYCEAIDRSTSGIALDSEE